MKKDGVTRYGDWQKARVVLGNLGVNIEKAFDREARKQVMRAVHVQKANIETGQYRLAPLSSQYKEYKRTHGLDDRTLIATGDYLNSITYWKKDKGSWVVGIRRGARTKEGTLMSQLGMWLEYGTSGMPARPHWRPLRQQLRTEVKRGMSTAIRKGIMG